MPKEVTWGAESDEFDEVMDAFGNARLMATVTDAGGAKTNVSQGEKDDK